MPEPKSRFNDDATAQAYQRHLVPIIFEPWGRLLIEKVGLKPGDRVLDIATGPGTLARQAAVVIGASGTVTGVDLSPKMLVQAQAQAPVVNGAVLNFIEASAEALPFADAEFDVVLCQQGLQFFGDQARATKEMKRVLKPGGRLALAMWSDAKAMTLFVAFLEAVDATVAVPPARSAMGWLDLGKLTQLLKQAGFVAPEVTEQRLVTVLEQGLPQALQCLEGTTAAQSVRAMTQAEQGRFVGHLTKNLAPWTQGHAIHAPVRALVAIATA